MECNRPIHVGAHCEGISRGSLRKFLPDGILDFKESVPAGTLWKTVVSRVEAPTSIQLRSLVFAGLSHFNAPIALAEDKLDTILADCGDL